VTVDGKGPPLIQEDLNPEEEEAHILGIHQYQRI
jgi:hypothetical protein